ncbi:MAG: helix-hairpin-helix domain-containing protein [Desulfomicrobium escambiense]|nr:helix-hairpin-helix domain-containing protein [Desulfomicrobium escambiense]
MSAPAGSVHKLTDLPNIGKTTAAKLEKIGIKTAEDFLKRDPYDVFHELRTKVDKTLCRCALAGIVGAKTGEPWHKITKKIGRGIREAPSPPYVGALLRAVGRLALSPVSC